MKRKIIEIDRELCNGCGICVTACHEGAIKMIDGKAELISDIYCDGLGDCLPACPTGAIEIIDRDAGEYDQVAVDKKMTEEKKPALPVFQGCPGTMSRKLKPTAEVSTPSEPVEVNPAGGNVNFKMPSQLQQWPVQLNLINPAAGWLKNADLLIAADCCAFSYGSFHNDFIKGRVTMIGCPKLDDNEFYLEKLTAIFKQNIPASITVVRMEVPCCGGMTSVVKQAMLAAETIVPYREVTISTEGEII